MPTSETAEPVQLTPQATPAAPAADAAITQPMPKSETEEPKPLK
jgi:hypothetical protein